MFREDGRWKEFGIGRDPKNFTYLPFWLFAILWAIVSYILISLLEDSFSTDSTYQEPIPQKNRNRSKRNNQNELTPGYYMLNESSTGRNGVPRYVYLGPEEPDLT